MKNDTKKTDELWRRLEEFRRRHGLYGKGSRLLIALSGGKDSVCLFRILCEQRSLLGLKLYAAHVHHGLRQSADRDLAFCRALCQRYGVELFSRRVDVAAYAREKKIGVEEAGRELRYEYLSHLADTLGVDAVLTAHTATDQCETLLMRLLRGAALRGLCGIPVKRGRLCRPLLCLSSREVIVYLRALGQDWVEDESNGEEEYLRNRVRHRILPVMTEENPAWEQTVLRNTLALRREQELLEALCRRALKPISREGGLRLDREGLRTLCREPGMEGLAAHAVAQAAERLGVAMPPAGVCERLCRLALEGQAGKRLAFGGGVMRVEQKQVVFSPASAPPVQTYCVALREGETRIEPIKATIRSFSEEKSENYKNINKMLMIMKINSATISGGLVARNRQAQDRIVINGMTKSVKKLLCDLKLPTELRRRIPVIADGEGIVWVPGVGLSDRARPREGEAFFTLEFQPDGMPPRDPAVTVLSDYTVPTAGTKESDWQA